MIVKIQDSRQALGYRIVSLNRRRAIKEYCFNCSGYSRKDREICWNTDCRLYPYRTSKGKQNSNARKVAIRAHCRDHCMNGHPRYVTDCPSRNCPLYAYRKIKVDRSVEINDRPQKPSPRPEPLDPRHRVTEILERSKTEPKQLSLF